MRTKNKKKERKKKKKAPSAFVLLTIKSDAAGHCTQGSNSCWCR
jgi:hypothetical protein